MEKIMEWQPIETAPKDGTTVLLYLPEYDEVRTAFYATAVEDGDEQWVIARSVGETAIAFIARNPSHWQPVPASPLRH